MYFVLSVSCAILDHSRSEVSDAPRIEGAHGKLAQLHRRVLTLGDRKQTRATGFMQSSRPRLWSLIVDRGHKRAR